MIELSCFGRAYLDLTTSLGDTNSKTYFSRLRKLKACFHWILTLGEMEGAEGRFNDPKGLPGPRTLPTTVNGRWQTLIDHVVRPKPGKHNTFSLLLSYHSNTVPHELLSCLPSHDGGAVTVVISNMDLEVNVLTSLTVGYT